MQTIEELRETAWGRGVADGVCGGVRCVVKWRGKGQYMIGFYPAIGDGMADILVGREVAWEHKDGWIFGQAYLGLRPGPRCAERRVPVSLRMPEGLHERLRGRTVEGYISLTDVILERLGKDDL